MKIWKEKTINDLYDVHNGLSKSGNFFGNGYPFLSFSTVFNNYFIPDELRDYVQTTEKERLNYSICRGDVFVTRTSETADELGMSCVALKDYPNATYNGFTKRLRPKTNELLPEYIGYYFRTHSFRGKFKAFSTMTTRASLKNEDLLSLSVFFPSMEDQKKISSVLLLYDNLIDNNQKQIKLLEEAAQRLYKEWFIDLRFPGHETTPIINGIPEGWTKTNIDCLCELLKTSIVPDEIESNTPYIGLEHMPRKDFCLSTWDDSSSISSNKYCFKRRNILFGKIRPYFHKVGFAITDGVASTDSFVLEPKQEIWGLFLLTVSSDAFVNYAYKTCKEGAKMPRADWNQMKEYPLLVAKESIQKQFEKNISKITKQIEVLAIQNHKLIEARDRLLPKLMSGEIEV